MMSDYFKSISASRTQALPRVLSQSPSLNKSLQGSQDNFFDARLAKTLQQLRDQIIAKLGRIVASEKEPHLRSLFSLYEARAPGDKAYGSLIKSLVQFLQEVEKFILGLQKELESRATNVSSLGGQLQQLTTLNSRLADTISIQNQYSYFNAFEIEEDKREKARKNNRLMLENVTLQKEIAALADRLRVMETRSDIVALKKQIDDLESRLAGQQARFSQEIFAKEETLINNNIIISDLKTTLQRQENELKAYSLVVEQQGASVAEFKSEKQFYSDRFRTLNERLNMAEEEIRTRTIEYNNEIKLSLKAKEKLQKLQYRLDRIQIERTVELDIPEGENSSKQMIHLLQLGTYFQKDPNYYQSYLSKKPTQQQDESDSKSQLEASFVGETERRFSFNYPSYLIFLEHHSKTMQNELTNVRFRRLDPLFFKFLRSIWDSYWSHIQLSDDLKSISRFAEFLVDWFAHFTIDKQTRRVRWLNESEIDRADELMMRFVLDMNSPQLLKVWEVKQFKAMLEDEFSPDQAYFFLYCRFLLLRGSSGDCDNQQVAVLYIPLQQAELVFEVAMSRYEHFTVQHAKQAVRKSAKRVRRNQEDVLVLDHCWALQVLLQFFKIDKQSRFNWIQMQFAASQGLSKPSKFGLSFKQFKKMIKSGFNDVGTLTAAQLYRDIYAFNPASGVTPEAFMVVASETHFFTKQLKIYSDSPFAPLSKEIMASKPDNQACKDYTSLMSRAGEEISQSTELFCEEQLLQLGNFDFVQSLKQFTFFLKNDSSKIGALNTFFYLHNIQTKLRRMKYLKLSNYELFNRQSVCYQKIQQQIESIESKTQFNNFSSQNFFVNYDDPIINPVEEISIQLEEIQFIIESCSVFTRQAKRQMLLRNQKVKTIQRFLRKKFTKFYSFISSILTSRLKSHPIEDDPKRLLRRRSTRKMDKVLDKRRATKKM